MSRLRQRRTEILGRLADIGVPRVGTVGYTEKPALNQELATIEQTLAQVDSTDAVRRETSEREVERLRHDDAAFWSRRFHTSLALGNGAGFALVTAALLQAKQIDQALVFAWEPMCFFGPGLLCAGALPWLLWAQRRYVKHMRIKRAANVATTCLTAMSAGFFALAIGTSILNVTEAQQTAAVMAKAERQIEGAELARRWRASGLAPPSPDRLRALK